jgi:hypothetical protein
MPRNQESSIGHDPADSDDPLFRDRNGQSPDDPAQAGDTGDTPIGDELAAGRHAGPGAEATDSPGEWVAGSRGTGFAAGQDGTVVPEQADRPSVESTDDPLFGGPTGQARGDTTGTTDPADVSDTAGTTGDTEVVDDTADRPGADADEAPDLRTTGDPEVAPDSALNRDYGAPTNPDAPTLAETPADADVTTSGRPTTTTAAGTSTTTPDLAAPATSTDPGTTGTPETPAASVPATPAGTITPSGSTTAATGQPDAPVPGAPGTGSTTGVQAASASLVTNGAELHDDWARIQSAFVDDPQGSVSQAADLVTQVTNSLVSALQEREQTLRGAWDKQGADTENLRNALRDYRAFFEQLTKL